MEGKNIRLSCGICHREFYYNNLIKERSWNGKWDCYFTPCHCHTEQWSSVKELARPDKYLFRMTHDTRI